MCLAHLRPTLAIFVCQARAETFLDPEVRAEVKIITITGTRPNFVKEYAMNPVLAERGIEEVLVHTGQHYDYELSEQFFSELKLPRPNYINTLVTRSTHDTDGVE